MASIYGVTLKKLKDNYGHDGAGYASADVYYNGKRLGAWWQDGWGGPDHFDFNESVLNPAVEQYKASGRIEGSVYISQEEMVKLYNVECLLGLLYELTLLERKFKSAIKKGFKTLVMSEFGEGFMSSLDKASVVDNPAYKSLIEHTPAGGKISIYTSLDDFMVA